jgi:ribosomal protein L11 methyltransferase
MGFGTAHHASTRLCLRAMQEMSLTGRSVLDVGTGSGVLAIAAVLLGATRVVACDADPDAIASARENLTLNDVFGRVELHEANVMREPLPFPGAFDVIVANLTASLLGRQPDAFARLTTPDGRLIAGGLQPPDVAAVTAAYEVAGWGLQTRCDEDDWVGLVLARDATSPTPSTAR